MMNLGKENDCPGVRFIKEEHWESITMHAGQFPKYFLNFQKQIPTCNSYKPEFVQLLGISLQNISYYRDKLYHKHQKSTKMEKPCGEIQKDHSYEKFSKQIVEGCKTLDEMTAAVEKLFSPDEAKVLKLFLAEYSQHQPASTATAMDLFSFGTTLVNGFAVGAGAAFGAALGLKLAAAKNALSGLWDLFSGLGNLFDGLSNFFDALGDMFGDDEQAPETDNSGDSTQTSTESLSSSTTMKILTTTVTAAPQENICVMQSKTRTREKRSNDMEEDECYCFLQSLPHVQSECGIGVTGRELKEMKDLLEREIEFVPFSHGTVNEADLILSRAGYFFDNWDIDQLAQEFVEGKYICVKHIKELGTTWHRFMTNFRMIRDKGMMAKACMFKTVEGAATHVKPVASTQKLTRSQSVALLNMKEVFLPVGTRKCTKQFDPKMF